MAQKVTTASSGGPRLVERALDVLAALADGPRGLTQVKGEVSLTKATVHREEHRARASRLRHAEPRDGRFRARQLEASRSAAGSLTSLAGSCPSRRADAPTACAMRLTKRSVLHVRLGRRRVCVAEFETRAPLRYAVDCRRRPPVHVGAAGKVLLAWLTKAELDRFLADNLDALTDYTITSWEVLHAELADGRFF